MEEDIEALLEEWLALTKLLQTQRAKASKADTFAVRMAGVPGETGAKQTSPAMSMTNARVGAKSKAQANDTSVVPPLNGPTMHLQNLPDFIAASELEIMRR